MHQLLGETRKYAWGSRTLLPRFLDAEPDGDPHAEHWMGAHPAAPAQTPAGPDLRELIEADPLRTLGQGVVERFGSRLPFLMKALAAAEPLSLQVHPSGERARAGFDRENAAGIGLGASTRNYQDASHKPELIYAVTRFEGMAGFRDVVRSAEMLRMLDLTWATGMAEELLDGPPDEALRRVVTDVFGMPEGDLSEMLAGLTKAARIAEEQSHGRRPVGSRRHRDRTDLEREAARLFALTAQVAERYPRDPGVLVTLLLNHVVLAPGEAMFLDAGTVHAYTSGFGIEIMSASDNVVRAGLTPKHVDVPELLEIASFTPAGPPTLAPRRLHPALVQFQPDVDDFTLFVGAAPAAQLPRSGPRIVLVLDGRLEVSSRLDRLELSRGQSVFVGDDEGALEIVGDGRFAVGAVAI